MDQTSVRAALACLWFITLSCTSSDPQKSDEPVDVGNQAEDQGTETAGLGKKKSIADDGYDDDWDNLNSQKQGQNQSQQNAKNNKNSDEGNGNLNTEAGLNASGGNSQTPEPPINQGQAGNQLLASNALAPSNQGLLDPSGTVAQNQVIPANQAPAPAMVPPKVPGKVAAPFEDDILPAVAELSWVGYDYMEKGGYVRIELVTRGRPKYNVFQELNKAGQPELVVRFLQTKLRHKIRRDIDASEFRSPVAFVRMREEEVDTYVDVVLTMRDQVRPRLYAKNGNVLLTFQVPDRYFGSTGVGKTIVAKAEVLPGSELMPEIDVGSELPISMAQKQLLAKAYVPNPAAAVFGDAPPSAGQVIQPAALKPEEPTAELPANFSELPVNTGGSAAGEAPVLPMEASSPPLDNLVNPPVNPSLSSNANGGANGITFPDSEDGETLPPPPSEVPAGPVNPNAVDPVEDGSNEEKLDQGDGNGFDDDELDDFDDGKGESTDEIDKFDVRGRSTNKVPTYAITSFSVAGVAQDDLDQGNTANGANSNVNPNSGNNTQAAPAANNSKSPDDEGFTDAGDLPANSQKEGDFPADTTGGGNSANAQGFGGGDGEGFDAALPDLPEGGNGATANAAAPINLANPGVTPPVNPVSTEPAINQGVDLQGQEAVGQESEGLPPGSKGGRKIKLDFRGAPLAEVIRVLGDESGINFVMPPDIGLRNVTTNLVGIPFNDALKAVLDANALGMVQLGPNIVRIDSLEKLRKDKEDEEARRKSEVRLRPTKILVHRLSYAKVEDAVSMLTSLLESAKAEDPRVSVQTDKRTNSLILHASPAVLTTVKVLLDRLDFETPQVKIASRIVEVTKKFNDSFGISWGGNLLADPGRGLGLGNLVFPNYALSKYSIDAGGNKKDTGNFNFRFGSVNNSITLDLALSMQEVRGTTEILQSSDLTVEDNVEAQIVAGSTDYFRVVTSGTDGTTGLSEVNYNLTMRVTPHITADGAVQMKVSINSDSPTSSSSSDGVAGKNNRSLITSMLRKSGETAVIGGVYTTDKSHTDSGVPFFSTLPIIGALFRKSENTENKRELLVMVTPTIVSNAASGNTAGNPSAELPEVGSNIATNLGENGSNNAPVNGGLNGNGTGNFSQNAQTPTNTQNGGEPSNNTQNNTQSNGADAPVNE